MLYKVVAPTKVLSAGGDDTFVGCGEVRRWIRCQRESRRRTFFVSVNRPDVSLEVFAPEETLSAPVYIASEHPSL